MSLCPGEPLPLLSVVEPRGAGPDDRCGERGRCGLLPPPHHGPQRGRHPAARHALPLGPAPGRVCLQTQCHHNPPLPFSWTYLPQIGSFCRHSTVNHPHPTPSPSPLFFPLPAPDGLALGRVRLQTPQHRTTWITYLRCALSADTIPPVPQVDLPQVGYVCRRYIT